MPHLFHSLFLVSILAVSILVGFAIGDGWPAEAADLERGFAQPPHSAKPWVYYFIMDGNLSRPGITADLQAMKRVGIGGLLIMEVDVGVPRGPVEFMSPQWRQMFKHLNQQADRLGLDVTINASGGWTGSGGPWIKPQQSMQKLVASQTDLTGPQDYHAVPPQPETVAGFYRDVAVLAFPTPEDAHQITRIAEKAVYHRGHFSSESEVITHIPMQAAYPSLKPQQVVPRKQIVDLSDRLDAEGRLRWRVPQGNWTVLRFGHTSTGTNTRPAPKPGLGLECDKFDTAALDAHFENYLGKLLADIGPLTGKSLVATHIDSWEMQAQNWTARFPQEFSRRRGYDPMPYLPVMTGRVVEGLQVSERFLWDLRRTILELICENYSGHLAGLAHRHGLRLSIEPNDGTPCDDMTYGARADVPMCEFWSHGFNTWYSVVEASSIAHVYGKRVVQAEAFTAAPGRSWLQYPESLKALADVAYCEGVNRFVIHRYAHQPWPDRWPGMTMGPYGVHCERTQTWWEQSTGWFEYMARCQFLLQQGLFVADFCYLTPEASPQVFHPLASPVPGNPAGRFGHNFDGCTPQALLTRMRVEDGRLVLPDGMSYRMLVLPKVPAMTPQILRKIKELVDAGATVVVGPRPVYSPSLSDYPRCDYQVKQLADELWGQVAPTEDLAERSYGKGRVIRVRSATDTAHPMTLSWDNAHWIWHGEGNPAVAAPVGSRYFHRIFNVPPQRSIASAKVLMTADNSFELLVNGKRAGRGDSFQVAYVLDVAPLLKPGRNVLAVTADNGADSPNPAGLIGSLKIRYDDGTELALATDKNWETRKTIDADWQPAMALGPMGMGPWGHIGQPVPKPDVYFDANVISQVFSRLDVPPDFESDVPLRFIHRRDGGTDLYFLANGQQRPVKADCTFRVCGKMPEIWDPVMGKRRPASAFRQHNGRTTLPLEFEPGGSLFVIFRNPTNVAQADGRNFPEFKTVAGIDGPWIVKFDPKWGGPESVVFDQLTDWTERPQEGVRHYSGTATYERTFSLPAAGNRRLHLDLGKVKVMARVELNGRDLGVLWKTPFRVDVTQAVRPGENTLKIHVVNLWPNRLIGDSSLPPEDRYTWTTVNPYTTRSSLQESGLLGPVTVQREVR